MKYNVFSGLILLLLVNVSRIESQAGVTIFSVSYSGKDLLFSMFSIVKDQGIL